jgi:NADPH2 dehydrogenase
VKNIGAEKVAVRFSPYAGFQGSEKTDFIELYTYLIMELKKMNVKFAYLSLVEATGDPVVLIRDEKNINVGKTLDFILEALDNYAPVMAARGYQPDSAAWVVEEPYKKWDLMVAFGLHFIANPDLVFRFQHGIPLTKYKRATVYLKKQWEGYNDYPFGHEFLKAHPRPYIL